MTDNYPTRLARRGLPDDRLTAQFDKYVSPLREEAWTAAGLGAEYGQIAIRFSFILNGCALFYVIHLVIEKGRYLIQAPDLATSAWSFAAGICVAGLSCLSAYLNFGLVAAQRSALSDYFANAALGNATADHTLAAGYRKTAASRRKRADKLQPHVIWTAWVGVIAAVASYGLLIFGASTLVPGALTSLLPPKF